MYYLRTILLLPIIFFQLLFSSLMAMESDRTEPFPNSTLINMAEEFDYDSASMNELCLLLSQISATMPTDLLVDGNEGFDYSTANLKKLVKKVIDAIIERFCFDNNEHYVAINDLIQTKSLLAPWIESLIAGINDKKMTLSPTNIFYDFPGSRIKRVSQNGRFMSRTPKWNYGKKTKTEIITTDTSEVVATIKSKFNHGFINNQGTQVLSEGARGKYIEICDISTPQNPVIRSLDFNHDQRRGIKWAPDGTQFAILKKIIFIYSLVDQKWECTASLDIGDSTSALGLSWSPDGKKVAAIYNDETIRIWDVEKNEIVQLIANVENESPLEYSPCGNLLALMRIDHVFISFKKTFAIQVYDLGLDTVQVTFEIGRHRPTMFNFHPSENFIIVVVHPGWAHIYDFKSGQKIVALNENLDCVYRMTFNATGSQVISGSGVWDIIYPLEKEKLLREKLARDPGNIFITTLLRQG